MDNKYYTPSIEEFHVGFEYGYYDVIQDKWIITTIKNYDNVYECPNDMSIDGNICAKYIRVKYLDKDDIESLGFIDISAENSPFDIKSFTYKSEVLTLSKDGFVQIYHADLQKTLRGFLFMGTVKNKSELARLLKQLNIQ